MFVACYNSASLCSVISCRLLSLCNGDHRITWIVQRVGRSKTFLLGRRAFATCIGCPTVPRPISFGLATSIHPGNSAGPTIVRNVPGMDKRAGFPPLHLRLGLCSVAPCSVKCLAERQAFGRTFINPESFAYFS